MTNHRRLMSATSFVVISILMSGAVLNVLRVAAAPPPLPTGVDGVIGPEWASVTPTFVPYTPSCSPTSDACGGQLVAFNVYTRSDANYLYVAAQALPAAGDGWNDAVVLGNNVLANMYLNTIFPSTTMGSTILSLPGGDDCTGLPGYEKSEQHPDSYMQRVPLWSARYKRVLCGQWWNSRRPG